jgi:hypothetical protein
MAIVGTLLGLYAAFCVFAYFGQRKMLYPAPIAGVVPVMDGAKMSETTSSAGRTVFVFHSPAPDGGPTVVHFHGNGEELADLIPLAWAFRRAGIGFFAAEYPGYGRAKAYETTEQNLYTDAEAALWHLHNTLGVSPERVVLEGQSLGTGVATEMARRGHGVRLVLISPFTSIPDMAAKVVPLLPVGFLIRDRFDNAEKAPGITVPVLIVHGGADELIPVSMGRRLGELLPNATTYVVEGGHHNDLFVKDGRLIVDHIAAFVKGEYVTG